MRLIREIPVRNISLDRVPLDSKVLMFAVAMLRGHKFPPVRVAMRRGGGFEIRDGRHRVTAARLTERGKIAAYFSDEPLR
jgi:hypothetical protein